MLDLVSLLQDGQYYIRCPTCRVEYPLPVGGAADLPNAFHINSLLELREELGDHKTTTATVTDVEDLHLTQ